MFLKIQIKSFSRKLNKNSIYSYVKKSEERSKLQPEILDILEYGYPESRCK
jgi:hypothetical protein